jgi:hypothetical protein
MAVDELGEWRLAEYLKEPREPRDNSLLRLSGAGYCSRRLGYLILGADAAEEDLPTLTTFEIGHAYHHMVQAWLSSVGLLTPDLTERTVIDPWRRIRGTADGFSERMGADWRPDPAGGRRVFEIKSISDKPSEYMGRELAGAFTRLKEPKTHHIDQATAYAVLWNESLAADPAFEHRVRVTADRSVTGGDYWRPLPSLREAMPALSDPGDQVTHLTFIYVCKDAGPGVYPIKCYTQPLSAKRWARLDGKFRAIWEKLDREELPPRDLDPWSPFSMCKFCPYLTQCKEYE